MNPFMCDDNITTYKYPTVKIIVSVILIVMVINRNIFFNVNGAFFKTIVAIICMVLVVLSIIIMYISFNEIVLLYEKRQEKSINLAKSLTITKKISVDDIIDLLENNDIVEIKVILNNEFIKIGASSDCRVDSFEFFNKSYYVDNREFQTVKEVQTHILKKIGKQDIRVVSIE